MISRRTVLAFALTTALAAGLPATARGTTDAPTAAGDHEPTAKLHVIKESVRLADGRRVKIFTKDRHSVFVRVARGTAPFGPARLIHRTAGECHEIGLGANAGTVAVTLRCYSEGTNFESDPYADDARALVSTDLKKWKKYKGFFPYVTVAVSPNGKRVVFSGFPLVFWQRGAGFSRQTLPQNQLTERTSNFVISDDGALTAIIPPEGLEENETDCRVDLWVRKPGSKTFARSYRSPESFYDGDQSCPYWYRTRINGKGVLQLLPENYPELTFQFTRNASGEWVPA